MAKQNKNITGQYASDAAIQGYDRYDPTGTLEARGDGSDQFHHSDTLFDEGFEKENGYRIGEDVHVVNDSSLEASSTNQVSIGELDPTDEAKLREYANENGLDYNELKREVEHEAAIRAFAKEHGIDYEELKL